MPGWALSAFCILNSAFLTLACVGEGPPPDPSIITIAARVGPNNLHPLKANDEGTARVGQLMYDSLMDTGEDLRAHPRLAERLKASPQTLALVGGERVKRQDSEAKRWASRWANRIRRRLLNDNCNDTGCGLKAFRREAFLLLPYFDHIHRYLPALMLREGFEVAFEPVNHRHRETGVSKYNNWGRLKASVSDLLGVMWLNTRARNPQGVDEV